MKMHHRTWFPFILIGLTVILLACVMVWVGEDESMGTQAPQPHTSAPAITASHYQADITKTLLAFQGGEGVTETRNALLQQRVPAEFLDLHFSLILMIDAYTQGDQAGGDVRYESLRSIYPWLP